jgi:hypothetical protein
MRNVSDGELVLCGNEHMCVVLIARLWQGDAKLASKQGSCEVV